MRKYHNDDNAGFGTQNEIHLTKSKCLYFVLVTLETFYEQQKNIYF